MPTSETDRLLELLDVRLDAFAMCEIDRGTGLACAAMNTVLVHFVLEGEGALECEHGRYELRAGNVVIVPKNISKRLEGPGPILAVLDVDEGSRYPRAW